MGEDQEQHIHMWVELLQFCSIKNRSMFHYFITLSFGHNHKIRSNLGIGNEKG